MLASDDYVRLMNNVRMRLPGALDDAIRYELFSTLDEFLKTSNAWREDINILTVADASGGSRSSYELDVDEHAKIVRLMGVRYGDPAPAFQAHATLKWDPELLELDPRLTPGTKLVATVALTVRDPVNEDKEPVAPDWVLEKYRIELEDGLLGRLMSQPAKPYTNATLAKYHMQRFRGGMANARVETSHENTYAAQRWRFPYFANGR